MFFFGVHGYDVMWHMALSAASFNTWPFEVPIFAGQSLAGYNFLIDFIVFLISKIGFSIPFIYFKLLPVAWFILFTFSLLRFGLLLNRSKVFIAILLTLSYFSGSLAYLITLWHNQTIWGSSGLVALQSLHALANLPFAFSLIVLLEILTIVKKDTLHLKQALWLAILLFLIIGFKFYAGVVGICIIGLFLLTKIFPLTKKSIQAIKYSFIIILLAAVSILLFYDPLSSSKTGAIFSLDPLATVHPIIERKELVYLPDLVNARYAMKGTIGPRIIVLELFILSVFIFFNFGVRLLGIFYILKKAVFKQAEKWEILALIACVTALLLNILLVQKGEWWNTVQFLYYSIFISTIFTAQFIFSVISKKNVILTAIALLLILITLPINIDLLKDFTKPGSGAYISNEELEGLKFLKSQQNGNVYVPLYKEELFSKLTFPYPSYANYDTPYVSALSGKIVFYSTANQLNILGVDYKQRLEDIKNNNCKVVRDIDYAYIVKEYRDDGFFRKCIDGTKEFTRAFENNMVWIYKKN